MNTPKQRLLHSVWDIHQDRYSLRPVDYDPEYVKQMMADIFCPGPSYIYILDIGRREFEYISPEVEGILGVSPEAHTLSDVIGRIHPKSAKFVTHCESKVVDFLFNKIPSEKLTKYKFVYNMHLRRNDGSYCQILHQAMALTKDGFGRMSKVLGIHTDIGHLGMPNNYRMSIVGLQGEPSYLNVDASLPDDNYLDPSHRPFTRRELEVIRLLADGHTAADVAGLLGILPGTVRTHRKNVLMKSKCPNMVSLVAKCVREGLV